MKWIISALRKRNYIPAVYPAFGLSQGAVQGLRTQDSPKA